MIIFFFTPPCYPATSNCCFYGAEAKLWKRLVVGFFPHVQGNCSSPFEALALRLGGKTPCQGGKYRLHSIFNAGLVCTRNEERTMK